MKQKICISYIKTFLYCSTSSHAELSVDLWLWYEMNYRYLFEMPNRKWLNRYIIFWCVFDNEFLWQFDGFKLRLVDFIISWSERKRNIRDVNALGLTTKLIAVWQYSLFKLNSNYDLPFPFMSPLSSTPPDDGKQIYFF